MVEYSKFYETNQPAQGKDLSKSDEEVRRETELDACKNLIQQLGYAHFDD